MTDQARLTTLRRGQHAQVIGLDQAAPAEVARRLYDLGFRRGTPVTCVRRAPLGSPTIYRLGESDICLRRTEAAWITAEVLP